MRSNASKSLMTGTCSDESLIEACRAGQTEAFGELVRRYQDRLYPTLLRLSGSPEDAQDLLQESFLRAYRKLDRYHGGSSFFTWLYRLSVNLAVSEKRRRRSRSALHVNDATFDSISEAGEDQARSDPSQSLEIRERDALIQQALNELAPDHRAILVLKEFDGLRYEQVAETLGIPIGTVRSRLHRARCELKEKLTLLLEPDFRALP